MSIYPCPDLELAEAELERANTIDCNHRLGWKFNFPSDYNSSVSIERVKYTCIICGVEYNGRNKV